MKADEIISNMMQKDFFSQWLGIRILKTEEGYCKLSASVRKEMLNGFGIAHGGFTYSVADSALAFASNSKGRQSLSIETSISHISSLKEGEEIFAEATCVSESNKLGHYTVKITSSSSEDKPVALFKGIVYKTSKEW